MTIKAILFDLDGTLINSVAWHFEALNDTLKKFGEEKIDEHVEKTIFNNQGPGITTRQKLKLLSKYKNLNSDNIEAIYKEKKKLTETIIEKKCIIDYEIYTMLSVLVKRGYKLAICSNAGKVSVISMLKKMNIINFFSVINTNDDVHNTKPDPEVFNKTIKELGFRSNECLVIEDSDQGIDAANKAGCFFMKVKNPDELNLNKIQNKINSCLNVDIIIPAAGLGTRFVQAGYIKPKPFIDVNGKPMIVKVLENLKTTKYNQKFFILFKKEHVEKYKEDIEKIKNEFNNVEVISIDKQTEGTACTVLFARKFITNNPVIVANSDELVDLNIDYLLEDMYIRNLNGNILVFKDKELNNKWSYAKVNNEGLVLLTKEKKAISPFATAGLYCFDNGNDLVDACIEMIINNDRTKGEFYFCPVYNYYIQHLNKKVGIYEINQEQMHGLGTPEDLQQFLRGK